MFHLEERAVLVDSDLPFLRSLLLIEMAQFVFQLIEWTAMFGQDQCFTQTEQIVVDGESIRILLKS